MQTYTHFRTVFDVSPAVPMDNAWVALVGQVRAWVARNAKAPPKGIFFKGGVWTGPQPKRTKVETRGLHEGDLATPEMWAVRYEHADGDVKLRSWTTNIAITQVNQREWRFAVELTHRLKPGFVGKEPAAPQPSSPNLIKELIESPNWISRIGSVRLSLAPRILAVGKANEFVLLLKDPQRPVPVVLVSCDRKTCAPKLDAGAMCRALAGTAIVYYAESPECDLELEHFLPKSFRSPNGTVRIYAPGADLSQEWTSTRHRFFTAKEIDDEGDEEIIGQIVRALTRSDGWRGIQSSVTSIDDIETRVRERRLAELRLRASGTSSVKEKQEMLDLFMIDNQALLAKNSRLNQDLKAESDKRQESEDNLARRDYDLNQARESVDDARTKAAADRDALQAVLGLTKWPKEVVEVAKLAVQLGSGRLVLTNEAIRSLEKSDFAKSSEAPTVIWRCLRAMADDLHDLVLQKLQAQQVAEEFKKRSKFDLTWTESKETKRDAKLMALRKIVHNGKERDITPHVKLGNKARLLRVHFCVDQDEKQIIIGHCGDHLDTYGTRRRR